MHEESWEVAGKGRRKSRKAASGHSGAAAAPPPPLTQASPGDDRPPSQERVARWQGMVGSAAAEVAASPFFAGLRAALEAAAPLCASVRSLVVYGLGSLEQPGAVHIRYQLGLATLLPALLPGLEGPPQAFDPVFSALDRAVLPACGLQVIGIDEGGRRVAAVPTLFYLAHCEDSLTDALLEANAAARTLGNVAILGNSLAAYAERWSVPSWAARRGTPPPETLLRLVRSGEGREVAVSECGFPVTSAFNDTSLHTFGSGAGSALSPAGPSEKGVNPEKV